MVYQKSKLYSIWSATFMDFSVEQKEIPFYVRVAYPKTEALLNTPCFRTSI
jgi:hypothetical protein